MEEGKLCWIWSWKFCACWEWESGLKKRNAERANRFAADGFCCGYRVAVRDRFLVRDEADARDPRFDKPGVRACHRDAKACTGS